MNVLKVDSKKCEACGTCIETCSKQGIRIVGVNVFGYWLHHHAKISKDICISCGTCAKNCPHNAIYYTNGAV